MCNTNSNINISNIHISSSTTTNNSSSTTLLLILVILIVILIARPPGRPSAGSRGSPASAPSNMFCVWIDR